MKLFTIAIALLLTTGSVFAQDSEEKAKKILDGLSKEMKSYKSIYIEFKSSIKGEGTNKSSEGKAWIKGDKYYYEDKESKTWNDTEYVWNLEIGDDVCYKSEADDEVGVNPSKLLRIWEDGFKYNYYDDASTSTIHAIKLFPKDPKSSKYHTVIIKVNKATNKISSMTVKTKDGITLHYSITKFSPNIDVNDSKFKFDKAKNAGITEEDL
ncbi:MAG: outer membrane lipoprotein carrier protein LolA [Flavobacteriales bacterium]|nr:outer membrane lipoprotein carrier protein LolA [Flavobacteriales bacterium]